MYQLLRTALDVSSVRRDVISNNLVNVNTKDFKRSDVVFEKYLNFGIPRVEFKTSNDKHIKIDNEHYSIIQDNSTVMRSDGNNVDLDIEKANQAANTLMYNTLISAINGRYQNISTIISGR
ncbi:flagellar basal body rod protein FlgB [Candidatus Arthromitus sp. SFB-rat-Yit]|uniref:flagellar basal body rod protein FlgB n=1 Tax=Candidatus Arthromitus sp. SFB-rat-Yit TaxID=1041504 RepID=UPI000227A1FB|nr:flagellar basal body rod protein FlgB [Candidatus Arthromitus sp. SFB-rat-Yit]BAK81379.1 flagellar basal body rod protein FlgB [Candidatus Arthromitus sp. SFB-rat-Yit]